jgi:hypothetical protein
MLRCCWLLIVLPRLGHTQFGESEHTLLALRENPNQDSVSCSDARRYAREIFDNAERLVDISWLCWGWGNEVNHYWEGLVIALLLGRKPLFNWNHKSWLRKVGTQNASHFLYSPMAVSSSNTNWGTVHELRRIHTIFELRRISAQTIR